MAPDRDDLTRYHKAENSEARYRQRAPVPSTVANPVVGSLGDQEVKAIAGLIGR